MPERRMGFKLREMNTLLGELEILDIRTGAVPPDDPSGRIVFGSDPNEKPAVDALGVFQTILVLIDGSLLPRRRPSSAMVVHVIGMQQVLPFASLAAVRGEARIVRKAPIHIIARAVGTRGEDKARHESARARYRLAFARSWSSVSLRWVTGCVTFEKATSVPDSSLIAVMTTWAEKLLPSFRRWDTSPCQRPVSAAAFDFRLRPPRFPHGVGVQPRHMLPQHFVCLIAAQARGAKVPAQHVAVGMEHDERIIFDRFHQEAEACFAPSQFSRGGLFLNGATLCFCSIGLRDSTIETPSQTGNTYVKLKLHPMPYDDQMTGLRRYWISPIAARRCYVHLAVSLASDHNKLSQ